MTDATVGVVGAGITGLAVTHYLARQGVDAVAFDVATEPGGVISTVERDGRILEEGPQRMRKAPAVAELIAALDLEPEAIEADGSLPLYVYADGALGEAPLDRRAFLRSDLLSWRGKLRLLAEPLTSAGRPDETVADLFTRKFGREAYEKLAGPLYGGIYGSDPARMPARYALAELLEREKRAGSLLSAFRAQLGSGNGAPPLSFESGMQALPRALAGTHADRVELGTGVTDVRRTDDGGDARYVLDTDAGEFAVDHVVVTVPADAAATLLDGIATGTDGLADVTYNPLALVHLHAHSDLEGFGYQVGYGEDLHTLGSSWNASLFGRDGVYTVFLGGMHDPEILAETDAHLGEVAAGEFETVMGTEATVLNVTRLERGFPAYDESWRALDDMAVPDGVHLATNYTARMGVPSRIREAREVADAIATATE